MDARELSVLPSRLVAETARKARRYAVLGIHGPEVNHVEGDVARVRMFLAPLGALGDPVAVDEDFQLPALPRGVQASEAIYEAMLEGAILARIAELEAAR